MHQGCKAWSFVMFCNNHQRSMWNSITNSEICKRWWCQTACSEPVISQLHHTERGLCFTYPPPTCMKANSPTSWGLGMVIFLDWVHVGQFAKKNRSESFDRSFSQVSGSSESNHGMQGSLMSLSDSAPPLFSFSNDCGSRSSINITTLKVAGFIFQRICSICLLVIKI